MSFITRFVVNLLLERPSRDKSAVDFVAQLTHSGSNMDAVAAGKGDTEKNRRVLSHIIGIERWGQKRLSVALGEPFVEGEYNPFRPSRETTVSELRTQLAETRAETAALVKRMSAENVDLGQKINHNSFGDITARAWIHYLDFHASRELKALK